MFLFTSLTYIIQTHPSCFLINNTYISLVFIKYYSIILAIQVIANAASLKNRIKIDCLDIANNDIPYRQQTIEVKYPCKRR
jgi:hypothetical protein